MKLKLFLSMVWLWSRRSDETKDVSVCFFGKGSLIEQHLRREAVLGVTNKKNFFQIKSVMSKAARVFQERGGIHRIVIS